MYIWEKKKISLTNLSMALVLASLALSFFCGHYIHLCCWMPSPLIELNNSSNNSSNSFLHLCSSPVLFFGPIKPIDKKNTRYSVNMVKFLRSHWMLILICVWLIDLIKRTILKECLCQFRYFFPLKRHPWKNAISYCTIIKTDDTNTFWLIGNFIT